MTSAELDATPVSITLSSLDRLPIGLERTMIWDATGYGGHGEAGVGQPRRTWLFAEGSQGFFHTFLLLLNPNAEATTATLTFLPEREPAVVRTFDLPPMSRLVVDAGTVPELLDRSFGTAIAATQPILAERAMYFGNTPTRLFAGGHASAGAPDASTTWLFAEGATGAYFDTYVLLANPGTTPATVTLRYLLDNGTTITQERTVAPNARLTVDVEQADPRLASAAFSTEVTSDVPIVAERSMYWVGEPGPWTEAHNTVGVTAAGTKWLLAEGREGGERGFQTYILLANTASSAAEVTITYLKTDGTTVVRQSRRAAGEPSQRPCQQRRAGAGGGLVRGRRRGDQRRRHRRRAVDVLECRRRRLGRGHEHRGDAPAVRRASSRGSFAAMTSSSSTTTRTCGG